MAATLGCDTIEHTNGTEAATISTSGRLIPSVAGGIIQVQYNQSTTGTYQAHTAHTYTKLTNFPSVTITPTSTSSKLMIDVMWNGEFDNVGTTWGSVFVLYRDNTLIKGNTDSGFNYTGMFVPTTSYTNSDADSTAEQMTGRYFDEPSTTSAITYYLGLKAVNTGNIFINRVVNGNTGNGYERMISNMTIMEIAG